MNEEPIQSYQPSAPIKKSHRGWKITGIIILVLVLTGAAAVGVYMWQQNELAIQKKQYDDKLAAAAAKQEQQKQTTTSTSDRPAHEQAPPKTETKTTCNADELTLSLAQGDGGGAGTLNQLIVLKNSGNRTCTLFGFPGVSLVNSNGNMIGSPADRVKTYTEKELILKPNDQAKAIVSFHEPGNYPAGVCKTGATKLRVYPPNDTGYLSVASTLITAWCPGFEISPVQ
jgi:hypothetical protein